MFNKIKDAILEKRELVNEDRESKSCVSIGNDALI